MVQKSNAQHIWHHSYLLKKRYKPMKKNHK